MSIKRGIIFFSLIILAVGLLFINSKSIKAQASQPIPGTITLAWTDASSNELGFYIERQSGAGSFAQIAQVGANVQQYIDTTVQQLTTYQYRVASYNSQGQSAYSNIVQATTPAFVCGNGILQNGEQCDDGNTLSGDGCSSTCTTESSPTTGSSSGGGGSSGGTGISGNTVSTPPSNNNQPGTQESPPEQSSQNNNPENPQASSSPTTGNAITEFLSDQANIINIVIFVLIILIAAAVYFRARKLHKHHVY